MCGIVGVIKLNGDAVDRSVVERMTSILRHRGPDDQALWCEGLIGLGHSRLSIIDLSTGGSQPMHTADERYVMTYNGEIYNYVELRDELEQLGFQCRSQSDTEVVLNSYLAWGEECLKRFNGMWAFAIWDRHEKSLFCARDHFGIKPFYYYYAAGCFVFASEAKALLSHPDISPVPNDSIIHDYLLFSLADHREDTFFQGIKQLPAAHFLTLTSSKLQVTRWWDLDATRSFDGTDAEKRTALRDCFSDSVRLRLRADVAVGSLLSGGLDSSSIVCSVAKLLGDRRGNHCTITASYDDRSVDETRLAQKTADFAGVKPRFEHLSSDSLWEDLPKLVYDQDFPFNSTSVYAQWRVMRAVKTNDMKVVMDGQGADECLAGYDIYFSTYLLDLVMGLRFRAARDAYKTSSSFSRPGLMILVAQALHTQGYKSKNLPAIYRLARQDSYKIVSKSFLSGQSYEPYWKRIYDSPLKDHLYQMMFFSNLPALLRFEDRNSMAHSVESRPAFLDHRFVELCFSLTTDDLIRHGWTKYQFREAMEGTVPEDVRLRRDKMGFPTPEQRWLREKQNEVRAVFSSRSFKARGYFDVPEVQDLFSAYLAGKPLRKMPLWRVINLELWLRCFVD